MKKSILTTGVFLSLFIGVKAQQVPAPTKPVTPPTPAQTTTAPAAPVNPNAPEILFDVESHDFGTFDQGGDGTFEFKFKNTGKEPLIISNAQGSCGCTVPKWPKDPIAPGHSDVIKVTYDTKRVGGFTKTVTLTSNAKTQTKVLTIKGNIKAIPPEEQFPSSGMEKKGMPYENNK